MRRRNCVWYCYTPITVICDSLQRTSGIRERQDGFFWFSRCSSSTPIGQPHFIEKCALLSNQYLDKHKHPVTQSGHSLVDCPPHVHHHSLDRANGPLPMLLNSGPRLPERNVACVYQIGLKAISSLFPKQSSCPQRKMRCASPSYSGGKMKPSST